LTASISVESQGDQIGRILAFGAVVHFGQFFLKTIRLAKILGLLIMYGKNSALIIQNWIGLHFGRFFS
jgi:hypothetical protein